MVVQLRFSASLGLKQSDWLSVRQVLSGSAESPRPGPARRQKRQGTFAGGRPRLHGARKDCLARQIPAVPCQRANSRIISTRPRRLIAIASRKNPMLLVIPAHESRPTFVPVSASERRRTRTRLRRLLTALAEREDASCGSVGSGSCAQGSSHPSSAARRPPNVHRRRAASDRCFDRQFYARLCAAPR